MFTCDLCLHPTSFAVGPPYLATKVEVNRKKKVEKIWDVTLCNDCVRRVAGEKIGASLPKLTAKEIADIFALPEGTLPKK